MHITLNGVINDIEEVPITIIIINKVIIILHCYLSHHLVWYAHFTFTVYVAMYVFSGQNLVTT